MQINREADSRNATISLRSACLGTFARTTLNGGAFADPILNGSTPLGAFNSDIFTAINVIKSPSASNLAGGLVGQYRPAHQSRPGAQGRRLRQAVLRVQRPGQSRQPAGVDRLQQAPERRLRRLRRRGGVEGREVPPRLDHGELVGQQAGRDPGRQPRPPPAPGPVYDALIAANPGASTIPARPRQLVKHNRGATSVGRHRLRVAHQRRVEVRRQRLHHQAQSEGCDEQPSLYRRGPGQRLSAPP
ncbi:hypothetical protein ACRAWD_21505 [Caulobacter segnis]